MENLANLKKNYLKYKWFITSAGKLVIGGKNAEQNDKLLNAVKNLKANLIVMHTTDPGSPFSVILHQIKPVTPNEIKETAVFTASFSQAWKKGMSRASVDIFTSAQLKKEKSMKIGTWGVSGKVRRITVPLQLSIIRQKGILRAIPSLSSVSRKNVFFNIAPGKNDKTDFISGISSRLNLDKEQLMSALPSGGCKISPP